MNIPDCGATDGNRLVGTGESQEGQTGAPDGRSAPQAPHHCTATSDVGEPGTGAIPMIVVKWSQTGLEQARRLVCRSLLDM